MRRFHVGIVLLGLVAATGCSDFERTTFNTLSSSKAVLDTAQQDYENRTIPRTPCAYSLINNGKAAQAVAVTALQDYHNAVVAKANPDALKVTVVSDLATLEPIVVQVQGLISNPNAACGGSK